MKNITIDARMINASGIGTVVKNILKRMIYLKPEWNFNILGNYGELNKFEYLHEDNVNIIKCDAPIYSIREQFELIKTIPENTDVFWAPHYNIPIFYGGKLVVTVHDVFHLAMPQFVEGVHKKVYAKFMFNMVKRKADKIITVSNFTASELKKYVGVSDEKIQVIYNGIDEEWFNVPLKEKVHHKPYILFVGNVKPHKNLKTLVKAFLEVKDNIEHDLIIVGKKDGFITGDGEVSKYVKGNEDRIIFTGYVEDDILKQYYKQADIFVFPSLYEGFGLPPLEALAAGCKRVICSNAASIPEVCSNMVEYFGFCDFYYLGRLIMTGNNRHKNCDISIYDWNTCAKKYINMFN